MDVYEFVKATERVTYHVTKNAVGMQVYVAVVVFESDVQVSLHRTKEGLERFMKATHKEYKEDFENDEVWGELRVERIND